MEPEKVRLTSTADPGIVELLRKRLARDGDPPISVNVDGEVLVLSADTALTMLRSRVLAALEDVAGDRAPDLFEFAD
jgi:hypothetical protein